ncbi:MAG: cytochrome C [Pseudomonadota bacterium]|nr:cytochrome C [Pseudomonadota bacterium]
MNWRHRFKAHDTDGPDAPADPIGRAGFSVVRHGVAAIILAGIGTLLTVIPTSSWSNPLFARQTGLQCASCHTIYPELTPFGRKFKLGGYVLGERQKIPLAFMAIVSSNTIKNNEDKSTGDALYGKNGNPVFESASVFSGGKITDNFGAFVQWTYNNINTDDGFRYYGHGALDNTDLRLVKELGSEEQPIVIGLTLHNNPTVQDAWNTTPAWSYPYYSPTIAAPGRGAATFLESGNRVAGLGAYAFLHESAYLELTGYKTSDGLLSVLRNGTPDSGRVSLDGVNPYWRVAYTFQGENQNLMIGHFGTRVSLASPDGVTQGDRFRDIGFDAQYQYFSSGERDIVTVHLSTIHELSEWRSGFSAGANDNPTSTLRSTRGKITYLRDRTYGVTLGGFNLVGDADFARFNTNSGTPNTSGYIVELNYWPKFTLAFDPQANVRFGLQYTGYTKYNGSKTNYDSTFRNAVDNNTIYFYAWLMF